MSKKNSGFTSLRYPNNPIGSDYDYIVFDIKEYVPNKNSILNGFSGFNVPQNASGRANPQGRIILPMPEGILDNNSVNWTSDSLNSVDAKIFNTLSASVNAANVKDAQAELAKEGKDTGILNVLGKIGSKVGGELKSGLLDGTNALQSDPVKQALKTKFTADAANIIGANVDANRLISRSTGQVLNPNMELLFSGVNLRTFNFSFSLTPRDRSEAQIIKGIIKTFKRRMAAKNSVGSGSAGASVFISSPDVFDVRFMSGGRPHPFLFSMKTMALKSMNVNYMDGTPYMTYDDATPVKMRLNLQMQELVPIYTEDYDQKDRNGDDGVGF